MKNTFVFLFFFLFSMIGNAQRVVYNSDYISSNINGKVTKVEVTNKETILHFEVHSPIGSWIAIPKETYIEDSAGKGTKIYITKTEGITLSEKNYMIDSDKIRYKLFFPPLDSNVKRINYGEANKQGNWFIYKLNISKNGKNFLNISNVNSLNSNKKVKKYNIEIQDDAKLSKFNSLFPKDLPIKMFGNWCDKYGSIVLTITPDYIIYNSKIQFYQNIQKNNDHKFIIITNNSLFEIFNLENNIMNVRTDKLSALSRKPLSKKLPKGIKGEYIHGLKVKRLKITDYNFYINDYGDGYPERTIKKKIDLVASSQSGNRISIVIYNDGNYVLYLVRKKDNGYSISPRKYPSAKYIKYK
ncbi:hypothetical protein [Flavicella sp.]|uniref:hypothetical protein n=1 Tax=Flavicella sp. TaxID=2957742 RepID=UPI0030160A95